MTFDGGFGIIIVGGDFMTVVDRNKIDIVYVEEGKVFLCISDHLNWENDNLAVHWQILQDKIKDYMGFIQSGQFKEKYPNGEKPCIKICFSYEWPEVVDKYLNKLKDLHAQYGCELTWVYDPR